MQQHSFYHHHRPQQIGIFRRGIYCLHLLPQSIICPSLGCSIYPSFPTTAIGSSVHLWVLDMLGFPSKIIIGSRSTFSAHDKHWLHLQRVLGHRVHLLGARYNLDITSPFDDEHIDGIVHFSIVKRKRLDVIGQPFLLFVFSTLISKPSSSSNGLQFPAIHSTLPDSCINTVGDSSWRRHKYTYRCHHIVDSPNGQ